MISLVFRLYNPKVLSIWILNPDDKVSGLQTPKDERRTKEDEMNINGVGANPCGRPDTNGQGQATAPTYPLYRSETIFDGT